MCPRCLPLDPCEVGRVTWEAGAALDGSTDCVQRKQSAMPSKAAPGSQVTLPTSQVPTWTHPGHIPTSEGKPPNLPANLTGEPHVMLALQRLLCSAPEQDVS